MGPDFLDIQYTSKLKLENFLFHVPRSDVYAFVSEQGCRPVHRQLVLNDLIQQYLQQMWKSGIFGEYSRKYSKETNDRLVKVEPLTLLQKAPPPNKESLSSTHIYLI